MSVFATFRRSVGLGGANNTSTLPIAGKPTSNEATKSNSTTQSSPSDKNIKNTSSTFANLILENKNGKHKATYPIRKEITKIGRLATNDIRIYRETVSRVHCEVHVRMQNSTMTIFLHVFNPKGLKINGREIDKNEKGERIFKLKNDDLIELFSNYFRVRLGDDDSSMENDENMPPNSIIPSNGSRKSIRMSLVRSKVDQAISSNNNVESTSSAIQATSGGNSERTPLGSLSTAKVGQARGEDSQSITCTNGPLAPSSSKTSMHKQGRRSLVFATPKRESISQQPWTAEPIKRVQKPISPKKPAQRNEADGDDSIVFMEEIEEEEDPNAKLEKKNEMLPNELDELLAVAPVVGPDSRKDHQSGTETSGESRQTHSASPRKVKRRSSFFGRAGVFANWNFGFYPEERKAAEEEDDVDRELSLSPSLSPITSPNGTRYLPDPRLDSQGRPRLPRSLSSPDGLGSGSPKRRIVSLRTATLLRQGQNAFEQQKLRSPPSSPTKSSLSNDATPSLMGQMQQILPLPTKDSEKPEENSDAEDEDEIDQSLSLPDEELALSIKRPNTTVPLSKPRKSDSSAIGKGNESNGKRKGRISMPAKLLSIVSVDGHSTEDIEDLKKQWLAEQEERNDHDHLKDVVQDAMMNQDQAHETDTDSENESDDEVRDVRKQEEDETQQQATPSSKAQYGMLRYMVRENVELTALLDKVACPTECQPPAIVQESPVVSMAEEISQAGQSDQKDTIVSDEDGDWQIVSPKRAKWEQSERKAIENRRVSDSFAAQKKQKISPKKKTQRRVTSALLTSLANESGSQVGLSKNLISDHQSTNERSDIVPQSKEKILKVEQEPLAVATLPTHEIVQTAEIKDAQGSPTKKRSPNKRSPSKRSPIKASLPLEGFSTSMKATHEEVFVPLSSTSIPSSSKDSKESEPLTQITQKKVESPKKAKGETRSPLKGISPNKEFIHNEVAIPPSSSPKRLRSRSPDKQLEVKAGKEDKEDQDKENEIPIALQSSSPAKKTRAEKKNSPIKSAKTKENVDGKQEEEGVKKGDSEITSKEKASSNTRRSKRITKKNANLDVPASEPAMPLPESDNVRTTRSGRSVRKPKDLAQPTTVIAIQSDPVEASTSSTGRVTRNRARKGAA